MAEVRLLESHVVDQIAAGEVVERPASVVKELVENALDAGSTAIEVQIEDGGRALVRVTDDGAGMDRQDAMMALERHATSKIRTFEDLVRARTLGFRGEALPSIAAVSRFELVTCPRGRSDNPRSPISGSGTRIRMDAGKLLDVREAGAAPGTVVNVRSLFHALPARRAFLRTAPTEWSHCQEVLVRLALARPDVAFTARHERTELLAEATTDPVVRANALLGEQPWVRVHAERDGLVLSGLAAPPEVQRPSATGASYLYVDGRWVRDLVLRRAILQAYRDGLPAGRHPMVVLNLKVPAGSVDVNVHPTKAEVRFRDPGGVAAFVAETLRDALQVGPRGIVQRTERATEARGPGLPFTLSAPEAPAVAPRTVTVVAEPPPNPMPETSPASAGRERPPSPVTPSQRERIAALVHERWWVVEEPDGIGLIDAGRLARRVAVLADREAPRRLLVPVRIAVPSGVVRQVETEGETLAAAGLVVARFSATEVAVRAMPAAVADVEPAEVLRVALSAGGDVREAWAERLPPAPVPDDLPARANALGLPLGPRVGGVVLT